MALASCAAWAQGQCTPPPGPSPDPTDLISDTRVLRRIALALEGTTPDVAELEALVAATTPEARKALLDAAIERRLSAPAFYDQMVRFGHEWISIGTYTKGAQGDAYQGDMAGHLFRCPGGTTHAAAYFLNDEPDAQAPSRLGDAQIGLRLAPFRQHGLGMWDQSLASRGERHPFAVALEKLRA